MAKVYQKKKKRDSLNCSSLRNSSSIALEKCFVDHHRCAASVPSPVAFHLHLSALVVFGSLFSSSQVLTAFEREFELRTTNAWDWHENQLYQPHSPTHHPHWLLSSSSASNTASLHTALNKSKQSCKWLEFAAANQWASHGPDFGTKTTSNLVEGVRGNEPERISWARDYNKQANSKTTNLYSSKPNHKLIQQQQPKVSNYPNSSVAHNLKFEFFPSQLSNTNSLL